MSDSVKPVKFKYDAIVLHSEDELEFAERFCETVRKIAVNGRSPSVITMEEFSMPGKQIITILNEAIQDARFIFISEEYYRNHSMGKFSGNVAITKKIPDRFVKLTIGGKCLAVDGSAEPSIESFYGLTLNRDWTISSRGLEKLEERFSAYWHESDLVNKTQNLSLAQSNATQEYNRQAPPTGENLLNVSNPSIASTESMQSFDSLDETEAKCPVNTSTLDLMSWSSDLEVDNGEVEAVCTGTTAQNPSLQTPNPDLQTASPGYQARTPGPDAPQGEPQPSPPIPNTPNSGAQAADSGLLAQGQGSKRPELGSQTLSPELQVAEMVPVPSGGRAATTAFPCGTTGNRVTTFQSLQGKGKPATAAIRGSHGRSMLDGASDFSVTSKPDEASTLRELRARRATERFDAQKKRENKE